MNSDMYLQIKLVSHIILFMQKNYKRIRTKHHEISESLDDKRELVSLILSE